MMCKVVPAVEIEICGCAHVLGVRETLHQFRTVLMLKRMDNADR